MHVHVPSHKCSTSFRPFFFFIILLVLDGTRNRDGGWNLFGKGENKFGEFAVQGTVTLDGVMTLGRTYVVVETTSPVNLAVDKGNMA